LRRRAWRIVAPRWASAAFDGEGARLTGGRWNSKGIPVVYLASGLALAALELLVHIDYQRALEHHLAIPADFDEQLLRYLDTADLPANWTSPAAISYTQAIGDAWIRRKASVLLAVPSAVVPQELNYLFNPNHPDAKDVEIGRPEPFEYDPRLLKPPPLGGGADEPPCYSQTTVALTLAFRSGKGHPTWSRRLANHSVKGGSSRASPYCRPAPAPLSCSTREAGAASGLLKR
jgi:RES domain-containing protein